MPEVSRFYGIVIKLYFADYAPPHFHAEYAEHEARIAIGSLGVLSGSLPARAMGLVIEWATLHRAELQHGLLARNLLAQTWVLGTLTWPPCLDSPARFDPYPSPGSVLLSC